MIKMKKVAKQKYHISGTDEEIRELFYACETWTRLSKLKQEDQKKQRRLNDIRSEERAEAAQLLRYAKYTGREKRAAYYKECLAEARREMGDSNPNASASDYYERKSNSSVMDGIAQGIAGAGAGLAAYARIEASNAAMDARNAANRQFYGEMAAISRKSHDAALSKARRYASLLEKLEYKLIDETATTYDAWDKLHVDETSVTVTETGAARVKVKVSSDKVTILGGTSAVVDGVLTAHIMRDGKRVGNTRLALPTPSGLDKSAELEGLCCDLTDPAARYTVEVAADVLWIIEV